MPDRTKAPEIQEIANLKLPTPIVHQLDNGIPVYETRMGTQDVVKLEIVFFAGRPYEQKKLVSRATASLLKEGTAHFTSAKIAEELDFYGASFSIPVSLDTSNVVFYSLTKYFEKLLPLLAEILTTPVFPEEELKTFVERNQQRLQVDLTRNEVVAYRKITELIFGSNHPYGYNSLPETYAELTREDLKKHFQKNYIAENCRMFISGKTNDSILAALNKHLGKLLPSGNPIVANVPAPFSLPEKVRIALPGSLQSAIRIGCRLFDKKHEDFEGMYFLNAILGGYFGSRLMTNIREKRGFTYNVFSTMDSMLFDGYFYIGAEVGNEFAEPTLKEVYQEFKLLQESLVPEDELQMVRNYLSGNLLTMLDGAFNVSDIIKTLVTEDLALSAFGDLVRLIKTISATEIRTLARKYLNEEQMWEVVVGN